MVQFDDVAYSLGICRIFSLYCDQDVWMVRQVWHWANFHVVNVVGWLLREFESFTIGHLYDAVPIGKSHIIVLFAQIWMEIRNCVTYSMKMTLWSSKIMGPSFVWNAAVTVTSSFKVYIRPSGRQRLSGGLHDQLVIKCAKFALKM